MNRVEMFMDLCSPITVAQHATLRSETLSHKEISHGDIVGHPVKKPPVLATTDGSDDSVHATQVPTPPQTSTGPETSPADPADTATLKDCHVVADGVSEEHRATQENQEQENEGTSMFYERELAREKDVFHKVRSHLMQSTPPVTRTWMWTCTQV